MKTAFYIMISLLIIAGSTGISVDRHFCSGALVDVTLLKDVQRANCGMEEEQKKTADPFCDIFDVNCCNNDLSKYKVDNFLVENDLKVEKTVLWFIEEFNPLINWKEAFFAKGKPLLTGSGPPWILNSVKDSQSLFCIYRN